MSRLFRYAVLSMLALVFTAVLCFPTSKRELDSLTRRDFDEDLKRWEEKVEAIGDPNALDLPGVVEALSTLERVFTEMGQSPDVKKSRLQTYFNEWERVYQHLVSQLCDFLGVEDEVLSLDEVVYYLHDPYVDSHILFRANLYSPLWNVIPGSGIRDPTLAAYDRFVKNSLCVIYAFTRVEPNRNTHLFRGDREPLENLISKLDSLLPPTIKLNAETECANTPLAHKWLPLSKQGSPQQQPQLPQLQSQQPQGSQLEPPKPQQESPQQQSQQPQGPQPKPGQSQQAQQTQEEKKQKQTFFQWLASIRPIKWLVDFAKRFLPSNSDKNNGDSTK